MIDFVIIPTIFVPHISNEEIASARNGSQFMGEKRIQKEAEIDDLLERAEKGENLWDEIIKIENEISSIKEKEEKYRETYITLVFLKRLEKIKSIGIGIYGIRYNGSIILFYPKVNVGDVVKKNQILGITKSPFSGDKIYSRAPRDCYVIGIRNQPVVRQGTSIAWIMSFEQGKILPKIRLNDLKNISSKMIDQTNEKGIDIKE